MSRVLTALVMAASLSLAVGIETATAGSIIANGDFSTPGVAPDPFASWTTTYGNYPTDGGGFALFSEGTLAQTELEQTFFLPAGTKTLSFDYAMESRGTGSAGVPPDSFQATIYDLSFNPYPTPADPSFPGFFSVDATGQMFYDPAYVTLAALGNGWTRVTLDISLLPSQDVLLEFLLNGSDDGRTTTASVDNVVAGAVPEPSHLLPFLASGLGWLAIRRRGRVLSSRLG